MEKSGIPVIQRPVLPCPECWDDPASCQGEVGKVIWIYCPHNRSGGIRFWFKGQAWPWRIYSPITWEGFLGLLNELNQNFEAIQQREREAETAAEKILADMPEDRMIKT